MAGLTPEQIAAVTADLPPVVEEEPISQFERETYFYIRAATQVREEGRAEGLLSALLVVLDQRGLWPNERQLATIQRCKDVDRLDRWFRAAFRVQTIEELLALDD